MKTAIVREQPPHMNKNSNAKMKSDSAIAQHLIKYPECAKRYTDYNFQTIGKQDHPFI